MPKTQLNVRISKETSRILMWLVQDFNESEGQVVARALDRIYQEAIRRYNNPDPITEQLAYEEKVEEGCDLLHEQLSNLNRDEN